MLRATVNGKPREFRDNSTILEALRSRGIEVPTLCHDERLKPQGACRLCVVSVKGWPHPATSCHTLLTDGMVIETETPELRAERQGVLSLLAHRYPTDAVSRFPDKPLHRFFLECGLVSGAAGKSDPLLVDDSHPYIHVDMSRCIDCYRCVRICAEVQGQFVWQVWNRGAETKIMPDSGTTLRESSCVSCGACVDTCPTGALEDKTILADGMPESWTKTTCVYCGTGCEMNVGVRNGAIVTIRPALDAPVSKGHLCVKGRYAYAYATAADRVTAPMIRDRGSWKQVTWNEALAFTADGFKRVLREQGPNRVRTASACSVPPVPPTKRTTSRKNSLARFSKRTTSIAARGSAMPPPPPP